MSQIAQTLSALDEPTRLRILNWVSERFCADSTAPAPVAQIPAGPRLIVSAGNATSTDEDLDDLFEPAIPAAQTAAPARDSVSGMLSTFVAEFQDVVREWNGADEPTDQRASNAA